MRRLGGDPAFWPLPDQSWAKSVRWSCGRPGWRPLFQQEIADAYAAQVRSEYARAWIGAQILHPTSPTFVVSGV